MENGDRGTAPFGLVPPLPRLTLRVGIVGHRPKPQKLPATSFDFVQRRLKEVFGCVDTVLAEINSQQHQYFHGKPGVRLVSGLAEGADQLAIEAMPEEWKLDAVLPFPKSEYENDFGELDDNRKKAVDQFRKFLERPKTTVTQLPGERPAAGRASADGGTYAEKREDPYAYLGGFLLRQIDVLVAVWDGAPEDGKGGTAEVVRAAVGNAIPTVWIHSISDIFARIIEGIDADGKVSASAADCCRGHLREKIEAIVGVPGVDGTPAAPGEDNDVAARLRALTGEKWPFRLRSVVYDGFRRFVERKRPRLHIPAENADRYRARLAPAPEDDQAAGSLRHRLNDVLLPRYAWADALAVAYSHRYRSAYFICYLLAASAVAIALTGIFIHEAMDEYALEAKAFLVVIELLMVTAVMLIVWSGRRARWKEKWMEYRSLAELLFNVGFLSYLAEHGRAQKIDALDAASASWLLWYLRSTIREIGLPHAQLDGSYQRSVLVALETHVVADQRQYHIGNATALLRMHEFLHRVGKYCFGLTFLLLLAFLAVFVWALCPGFGKVHVRPWLEDYAVDASLLAAFFPALGAAVSGIRETGDFERVAERSKKTAAALGECSAEIVKARRNLTLTQTGNVLLTVALTLTDDLDAWQSVYGSKRLELPS